MPVSQTSNNVAIALKAQSGIGTPASGSGAIGLRVTPSPSLKVTKQYIVSDEVRRDGQSTRGRHGSRSSSAAYGGELSVGSFDALFEAVLRGTWVAQATLDQTTLTSATTTANTAVFAGGSVITGGMRVGDMVKFSGLADAGNNGKWLRVVAISVDGRTVTFPTGSLILNATPDTSFSIIIAKTVINGATPVERYFTVEEYQQDIDSSLIGTDMKVTKLDFNAQPNKNIVVTWTFMGLDATSAIGASAPTFTSPTYTTTLPLVMVDGTIRIGGTDYNVLTGFQFTVDLGGDVPATLSATSPDVFLANAKLSGSFTAIRQDLTFFTAFLGETLMDFFIHCAENEADPRDFVSFYVGNASLTGADTAIAASGPMVATVPWEAGKDEAGGAKALTMLKVATSAP